MFDFKGNIGVFEFWIPIVFYHFAFYVTGFLPEIFLKSSCLFTLSDI